MQGFQHHEPRELQQPDGRRAWNSRRRTLSRESIGWSGIVAIRHDCVQAIHRRHDNRGVNGGDLTSQQGSKHIRIAAGPCHKEQHGPRLLSKRPIDRASGAACKPEYLTLAITPTSVTSAVALTPFRRTGKDIVRPIGSSTWKNRRAVSAVMIMTGCCVSPSASENRRHQSDKTAPEQTGTHEKHRSWLTPICLRDKVEWVVVRRLLKQDVLRPGGPLVRPPHVRANDSRVAGCCRISTRAAVPMLLR